MAPARGRLVLLVVGLGLLPLLVSAVQLAVEVGDDWAPVADRALIELRVRDVGRHAVELGLYSRDGWSHPGPAGAASLALPYRLSGSRSVGLCFGALLLNGAAIAGMAVIAARRGGLPLLLATVVGLQVVARALGPEYVRDPWNCSLVVLPFGLLLFLVWGMCCGDRWALPAGAVVVTFLAQTHVQYAALGFPLLALGGAVLVWRDLRAGTSGARRSLGLWAALSVALVGLLWLPTLMEELGPGEGNLSRIADWFGDADEGTHTIREALRIVFGQFGLPPEWVAGHAPLNLINGEPLLLASAPPPVLLLPCLVAVVVLWQRRCHDALRLCAVVAVALAVGVVAVARTIGIMYDYRLQWTWMVAMAAAVAVAWAGWVVVSRWPRGGRLFIGAGVAASLVLTAINTRDAMTAADPDVPRSGDVRRVAADVLDRLPAGDGDVILRYHDVASTAYGVGLLLQLERHAVAAKVERDPAHMVGDSRVHHRRADVRAVLLVAADDEFDAVLARGQEGRLVAYAGQETLEDRRRILQEAGPERERIETAGAQGELTPDEVFRALSELRAPGRALGVFQQQPPP